MAVSRLRYSQYTQDSFSAIGKKIGYSAVEKKNRLFHYQLFFSLHLKKWGKKEAEFLGFVIADTGKKPQSHCLPWGIASVSQLEQGRKQSFSQAVNRVMRSLLMKTVSSVADSDYSISLVHFVQYIISTGNG